MTCALSPSTPSFDYKGSETVLRNRLMLLRTGYDEIYENKLSNCSRKNRGGGFAVLRESVLSLEDVNDEIAGKSSWFQ